MKIVSLFASLLLLLSGLLCAKPIAPPEFDTPDKRLLFAVVHDDVAMAREALAAGAGLEAEFSRGSESLTSLQVCAILGNREVAILLLKKGASVARLEKPFRNHALGLAAEYNQIELLRLFIPQADRLGPIRADLYEDSFLNALKKAHLDALKLLVQAGVDPATGLYRHVRSARRSDGDKFGIYALWLAAEHGDPAVVDYFLNECGLDANHNYGGQSGHPLWIAVERGNLEAARLLIKNGANVNATQFGRPDQLSCLGIAMRHGYLDCVDLLLENGAKPVAANPELNPKIQADWAGFDKYVDRFSEMGVELDLWEFWQERYRANSDNQDSVDVLPESGLAAHLIEEDWEVSATVKGVGSNGPMRVAILGDSTASEFSDLLLAEMSILDGVEFVERSELDRVIREHKLNRAGLLKYQGLQELSGLVDAESILLVSTAEFNETAIFRIQLLDVRRGLVLNVRYAPRENSAWEEFFVQYASFFEVSLLAQKTSNRLPVSLVGVQANWGTTEGKRLEKELFLALQYALSRQPGLLLLDRESLKQLAAEKRIGGTVENSFESSGAFLSARVDVDLASGDVQKVVRQAARSEQSASETMVFEKTADGKTLQKLSREVVDSLTATLANDSNSGVELSAISSSIEADRKVMTEQAHWLYQVGLYPEAHRTIENVVALGEDGAELWKLYLMILQKRIPLLWPESRANENNNKRVLDLEHDRLRALERYLQALQEGNQIRRLDWMIDDVLEGFSYSLFRMRAVSMKRRYSEELNELEGHFKEVFDRTIKLMCEQRKLDDEARERLLLSAFWVLPHLSKQGPDEHERLVRESISGLHKYWALVEAYPRSVDGGFETWNKWVRKHGGPSFVADFYKTRGQYLLSWNGQSNKFGHGPSSYRTEFYQKELSTYLEGLDSLDAKFLRARQLREGSPQRIQFMIPRRNIRVMSLEGQKLYAAEHAARWRCDSGRFLSYSSRYGLAHFTSESLLREMYANEQAALERMRDDPKRDAVVVRSLERSLNAIDARLQELLHEAESVESAMPTVDAYVWDMSSADAEQNVRFYTWRGDWPRTSLFHADGAQWIIGKYHRSGKRVWMFRIDEDTRETSFKNFLIPEAVDGEFAVKSFILFSDKKIVFGGSDRSDTLVLDRETFEVAAFNKYVPYNASSLMGSYLCGHIHEGSLYYTAVPEYLNSRNIADVRAGLVFLKLDLNSLQHKVLFNFRRNPPETPLDKPLRDSSGNKGFDFYYNEKVGVFVFDHDKDKYKFDPASEQYIKLAEGEYRALVAGSVRAGDGWAGEGRSAGRSWHKPRFFDPPGSLPDEALSLPLYNYKSKELKVIGLNLKPLAGTSPEVLDEVAAAIRSNKHELNSTGGKYSSIFFQDPARFVFIENASLYEALSETKPVKK